MNISEQSSSSIERPEISLDVNMKSEAQQSLDNLLTQEQVTADDLARLQAVPEKELTKVFTENIPDAEKFIAAYEQISNKLLPENDSQRLNLIYQLDRLQEVQQEYSNPNAEPKQLEYVLSFLTRKNHVLREYLPNLNLRETMQAFMERDKEKLPELRFQKILNELERFHTKLEPEEATQYKEILHALDADVISAGIARHAQNADGIAATLKNLAELYSKEELFVKPDNEPAQLADIIKTSESTMQKQIDTIKELEEGVEMRLRIKPEFILAKIKEITRHNHVFKEVVPQLNLREVAVKTLEDKIRAKYPEILEEHKF